MFIAYREEVSKTGRGRSKIKKIPLMRCDNCKILYEEDVYKERRVNKEFHFCSKVCTDKSRKPGGILHDHWTKRNLFLHGSIYNFVGKKRSQTDYSNANQKRHETKKRLGSYNTSKAEEQIAVLLSSLYEVVERQVAVKGTHWSVDFYIPSHDKFVQVDGVYWHGLDRPLTTILEYKSKQDYTIYKKWLTDRMQDDFFGERLVRITDVQSKIMTSKELKAIIEK